MSSAGTASSSGERLIQAGVLVLLFTLSWGAMQLAPALQGIGSLAAVGFLLIAGTLLSEVVGAVGIPHLTGYLLAGIISGPHILGLIDHQAASKLSSVNTLALALIALEGGAELKLDTLRRGLRSLLCATLFQGVLVLVLMALVFGALSPFMPFAAQFPFRGVVGIALLWGVLSVTRSPSATLGILSQTKASGPLSTFSLSFVMTADVVVVVLLAAMLTISRTLIDPGASLSLTAFEELGHEMFGSIAIGTTLGLVLVAYIRLIDRQLLLVLVGMGFGLSEVLRYLHFDALLAFMVAGFTVQNLSAQGQRFVREIHKLGAIVYVVFFATAGAHLDVPLLRQLWPVALALCTARGGASWLAGRIASRVAGDPPVIVKWGWAPMLSQAGLALGLAGIIERAFPSFGHGFKSLALAAIALNEMIGPILFKLALDRSKETQASS
jgi:Kef-type K+ transport system membrane component KefB